MDERIVLLVEDNPDDVELTLRAFKKSQIGNHVHVVRDGAEALEYLFDVDASGAYRRLPEVVLLDLKLPKVDGLEVLRRVRADPRTHLLPVVVLGANSYVRKPVEFSEFLEASRQLGLYWLVLNRPAPVERG